jgi:antirestriction protein ArdC
MVQRRLQCLRLAFLAGLLAVLTLAPAPQALAERPDPQQNSLQSAVDSFVAYLKTETNEAMTKVARLAREHKDVIDSAKARTDSAIAELSEKFSGQKATLQRFGRDAAAMSEAWREAAASSWANIERSARDALSEIQAWMRNQSPPDENSEIHV